MEQEIQEAKSLYYSYKQYFSDYLPDLTKLGLKVVMALLVFVGGCPPGAALPCGSFLSGASLDRQNPQR